MAAKKKVINKTPAITSPRLGGGHGHLIGRSFSPLVKATWENGLNILPAESSSFYPTPIQTIHLARQAQILLWNLHQPIQPKGR
jgi:hypothetical protein